MGYPETILIVASSGRMLAQAARNAGLKPLVIDLFADVDTQAYAEELVQIRSLTEQDLAPAVDYFVERYGVTHVMYGSGFECYPEGLCYLNTRLIILGNQPDIFAKQLDKRAFFSTLDELNIPHPDVVFNAPDQCEGWLLKPMQGQGGVGIKHYDGDGQITASVYWQKFQAGTPCSVLFLVDGQQVQIVGFNTQYFVRLSETQEFVFSGVINSCDLPMIHKTAITEWLKQMASVFSLKGLNVMDFIYNDCCYVLEINPRPSASMQLYNEDLLRRHIEATSLQVATSPFEKWGTRGIYSKKNPLTPRQMGYIGYQVVYAKRDLTVPDPFEWPKWCMDLPESGNLYRAGQPLCSIIARHIDLRSVAKALLTKQQLIISKLERF